MSGHLTPEQLAQYMEVNADEFLELVRPRTASPREKDPPKVNLPHAPDPETFLPATGAVDSLYAICT
jgi:hypothetical protein